MSNLPSRNCRCNYQSGTNAVKNPVFSLIFTVSRKLLLCEATEFTCGFAGRSFQLKNLADRKQWCCQIARNGQDHICECTRFKRVGSCRHIKALIALIESGVVDGLYEPDRPESVFPSPQQLADEAGVELPF